MVTGNHWSLQSSLQFDSPFIRGSIKIEKEKNFVTLIY